MSSTGDYPIPEGREWIKNRFGKLNTRISEVRSLAQKAAGSAARALSGLENAGTAAQRDAKYGVPSTTAERVALANQQVVWFNTEKGWQETFFAVSGSAGLTTRGLVAGVAAAWYPVAGSMLSATRIQGNGFQLIAGGGAVAPVMATGLLVNAGGFATVGTNGLSLPIPGYYSVAGCVYFSGGGAMAYVACMIQESFSGAWRDLLSARVPGQAADTQPAVSAPGILFTTATTITLLASAGGAQNIYGDGINRRTFLAAKYEGPALVNP